MKFITVNPTWNVPPSIIENEYLPALQQDPQALERIGLKVTQDRRRHRAHLAAAGRRQCARPYPLQFPQQVPRVSARYAGQISVRQDKRAFSHGCMRVQNPLTYGEKMLSLVLPKEHYTEAKLERMFGGSEININFPKFIPVHLTYQTAFVDDAGKLQLRKDVYGRDARMIAILKSSERKVADIAVERAPNTSSKPVRMPVGMYGGRRRQGGGWLLRLAVRRRQAGPRPYRPRGVIGPRANRNGRYSAR